MALPGSSERTLLTYPTPGYTRFWIYITLAILAFAYLRFSPRAWLNPADQHSGPQGVMPFAWWLLIPIVILGASIFLAFFEGLFVFSRSVNPMSLEFDGDILYVNDRNGERAIPFAGIVFIRMIYGKSIFDAARTSLYRYAIGFGDKDNPEQVRFTVFVRAQRVFANFSTLVKEKNPPVEIKNYAGSFDGVIRWFKNRNSGVRGDGL